MDRSSDVLYLERLRRADCESEIHFDAVAYVYSDRLGSEIARRGIENTSHTLQTGKGKQQRPRHLHQYALHHPHVCFMQTPMDAFKLPSIHLPAYLDTYGTFLTSEILSERSRIPSRWLIEQHSAGFIEGSVEP